MRRTPTTAPPMTLGNAAAARVRLIIWCLDCRHQVEPDPAEIAERYGATVTLLDWHHRLVCSECGSRRVDMVVTGTERADGLTELRAALRCKFLEETAAKLLNR